MLTGQAPIPRTTHVNVSEPNAGCGVSGSYGCGSFSSTSIGKGKPSAIDVCMKTLPVISRGRRNETLTVNCLKYYLARRFWAHTTATRTITAHTMIIASQGLRRRFRKPP